MLARAGTGKAERLITTQLWVQGAIQSCGVEVHKAPRNDNVAQSGGGRMTRGGWNSTLQLKGGSSVDDHCMSVAGNLLQ